MRIRRRPQTLILFPLHLEEAPAPQPLPPTDALASQPQKEEEHRSNVDLGEEPSWPTVLPSQGGSVMVRSSHNANGAGVHGAQRQGTADAHGSLENGERDRSGCLITNAINGGMPAIPLESTAPLNVKEGIKSNGPKRRRRPAVWMEGSRCSRVNGRNWRCSQLARFGYSLCAHHVSMCRQSWNAGAKGGGRTASTLKLGCTEPSSTKSVSPLALAMVAAAPSDAIEHAANLASGGVQ